jgi:hypothetical protein
MVTFKGKAMYQGICYYPGFKYLFTVRFYAESDEKFRYRELITEKAFTLFVDRKNMKLEPVLTIPMDSVKRVEKVDIGVGFD